MCVCVRVCVCVCARARAHACVRACVCVCVCVGGVTVDTGSLDGITIFMEPYRQPELACSLEPGTFAFVGQYIYINPGFNPSLELCYFWRVSIGNLFQPHSSN